MRKRAIVENLKQRLSVTKSQANTYKKLKEVEVSADQPIDRQHPSAFGDQIASLKTG